MSEPGEPRVGLFFYVDGELNIESTPISKAENDPQAVRRKVPHNQRH